MANQRLDAKIKDFTIDMQSEALRLLEVKLEGEGPNNANNVLRDAKVNMDLINLKDVQKNTRKVQTAEAELNVARAKEELRG